MLPPPQKVGKKTPPPPLMSPHNRKNANKTGNRLIMMHEGRIIYDVSGEEKKKLHVSDLLAKFQTASGDEFANDRMILS